MSLEAVAGKNPFSHVGKIDNVPADAIARDIVARKDGGDAAKVQLLSTIGRPLDQPQIALVEVAPAHALSDINRRRIGDLVNTWFDRVGEVSSSLAHGRFGIV